MKYKLIGTDFDGTILTDDKKVTKETYESFKNAQKNNIITVGVTGRVLDGTKDKIDISIFDYLLLNNGSYIYDVKKDEVIREKIIPKKLVEEITNSIEKNAYQIDYCTLHKYYNYKGKDVGIPFIISIKNSNEVEEEVAKINVFMQQEIIDLELEKLKKEYPNMNIFTMQDSDSDRKWIVINPEKINKGSVLEELGKKLQIKKQEMIFFGDGLNDLEVIETVGLGVAMKNALPEVKERSKDMTEKTNNENGVAAYINKIIKKNKE